MNRTYYTQFRRLIELDKSIRAGEYPNALTFSARADIEASQKTVQRDIVDFRISNAILWR